jgi:hypothetical protein
MSPLCPSRIDASTGAAFLDALARATAGREPAGIDNFLATSIYLRTFRFEAARAWAMQSG